MRALFDKTRERFGRRRRPQGENRPEPIRVNPSLSAKMRKAPFGAFCIFAEGDADESPVRQNARAFWTPEAPAGSYSNNTVTCNP
jgi:hypothetical protein